MPDKDYELLNKTRPYERRYVKCSCGLWHTRYNGTSHRRSNHHRFFKFTDPVLKVKKNKIKKKEEPPVEYITEYYTIWGNYKC